MTEPLSAASDLNTLAGFAFQASKSLYHTIESFKSVKRSIREFRSDLESLTNVLEHLQGVAVQNEAEFAALKLPLLRCGKVCNEFEASLNKCVTHSDGEKRSFRDWAQFQYRGESIADLRTTLAGYKAIIHIALVAATFRQAAVTAGFLDEYKQLVEETKSDLCSHLAKIDEKLQSLNRRAATDDRDGSDIKDTTEEKESTEQCLRICQQVSEFIERSYGRVVRNEYGNAHMPSRPETRDPFPRNAEIATKAMLSDFRSRLSENSTTLNVRLTDLDQKLRASGGQKSEGTGGKNIDLEHLREERDSIGECLDIHKDASSLAERARTNIFEDVSSAAHSHQLVVSTIGDLISAKRIVTGVRSVQWLGQMSDDTLQKLSGDHRQRTEDGEVEEQKGKDDSQDRYATGYNLHFGKSGGKATSYNGSC
ncbi:hypothetical protein BDV41DRAFT_300693 [Aspergillus transmontanensis]|uniref:Azaphilone pigments biosynthesis cluster protein L N-terminal domain-containing protein n=1 Tax=Aspergillus transmontanensis TaxID=1034304 RepID=A0A5N6VZ85_9EURO|nr:hypothetical protein BDV41DRAFT_300693 [Aspergillus transmontanensis]